MMAAHSLTSTSTDREHSLLALAQPVGLARVVDVANELLLEWPEAQGLIDELAGWHL